ncbi:NAD-dependent malic enzyme [bacterium]|nr:NAD-dependent malic enzyme [bacterium]
MDYRKEALERHKERGGKIRIESTFPVTNKEELSVVYTPGVAAVSEEIARDHDRARDLTATKRMVAVVTDGSAVLGLGNVGPEAALPVMEGKCALFKTFANVEAFPIALGTQDVDEIVNTIIRIAPTFGGINLEDISAPRCFEIEARLRAALDIPVFHDDQHGTAIVVLAGLLNALKVTGRKKENTKIAVAGSGAAGIATVQLLQRAGFPRVTIVDSGGIVSKCRTDLDVSQEKILECCAISEICGGLEEAVVGKDVFIGVSAPNILTREMMALMNKDSIVFALANPVPEIDPETAKEAGAAVIATGRSDYPNQINNSLAFPGIFKGALEAGVSQIADDMKLKAAEALAAIVAEPTAEKIIPGPFDGGIVEAVSRAVASS